MVVLVPDPTKAVTVGKAVPAVRLVMLVAMGVLTTTPVDNTERELFKFPSLKLLELPMAATGGRVSFLAVVEQLTTDPLDFCLLPMYSAAP